MLGFLLGGRSDKHAVANNQITKIMTLENNNWSVEDVWNEQLTLRKKDRTLGKRDRIWASEIGKHPYERWLKMTGVKPDFEYDERTLRKFAAGNFFERIIGYVLIVSGLLKHDNQWVNIPADEHHLEVSVKPDFIAGGKPDWEKVRKELEINPLFELMPTIGKIANKLVETLREKYPDGLKNILYEIKSVNSQVFWAKKDYLQDAYPHHRLQCFTGLKATRLPEGRLLYISKDDLTVAEFGIHIQDEKLNGLWEKDVREITRFIREGKEPPKPLEIVFDERKKLRFQHKKQKVELDGCFVPNWEIEWSNYLPTITGCKSKEEWLGKVAPMVRTGNEELKTKYKIKHD